MCPKRKQLFHLFFIEEGDDIKPSAFNRLIHYAKNRVEELKGADDWNTKIGLEPIRLEQQDYWLYIDNLNEWLELTWSSLKSLLDLLELCYHTGHRQEFEAKLLYGSRRLARVRMYFYRAPEPDSLLPYK